MGHVASKMAEHGVAEHGVAAESMELASGEPTTTLVCKRNTVAPVWAHFGFEADAKGKLREPDRPNC